jgi:ribulose bisphosphate carboxylase small subunit
VWRGGWHIPHEYAERIIAAFEKGNDQALAELHDELNMDHELYIAVLGYLPSGVRRQLSEIIERERPRDRG